MYFYSPNISESILCGDFVSHFISLRKSIGDYVMICDQKGNLAKARISLLSRKNLNIQFDNLKYLVKKNITDNYNLLYQAIPDKRYLEKFMEILPLTNFQNVKLFKSDYSPTYNLNIERLEKILIRSTEQSQRIFRPKIEVVNMSDIIDLKHDATLLLDTDPANPNIIVNKLTTGPKNIIIGPEGGFSESELRIFSKFEKASLGETIYPSWVTALVISNYLDYAK